MEVIVEREVASPVRKPGRRERGGGMSGGRGKANKNK